MTTNREPAGEHPPEDIAADPGLALALAMGAGSVVPAIADLIAAGADEDRRRLEAQRPDQHRPPPFPRPGDITGFEEARQT